MCSGCEVLDIACYNRKAEKYITPATVPSQCKIVLREQKEEYAKWKEEYASGKNKIKWEKDEMDEEEAGGFSVEDRRIVYPKCQNERNMRNRLLCLMLKSRRPERTRVEDVGRWNPPPKRGGWMKDEMDDEEVGAGPRGLFPRKRKLRKGKITCMRQCNGGGTGCTCPEDHHQSDAWRSSHLGTARALV